MNHELSNQREDKCREEAGDNNKIITNTGYKPSNYDVDVAVGKPQFAQREFYSNAPSN